MSRYRSQIHLGLAVFLLIVMGFVVPPSVNSTKFRGNFSESLSRSLGRPVTVGEVHVRLLPLPGFTFRHLTIADDPEFGGEPILQTTEDDGSYSAAKLRLGSLWRGRLEIASISLTQASLNLARSPDGHWNLERLINRASQTPSAPTAKRRAESRNRFPYIELTESRINFKLGQEKMPFALSNSDFALWLAAENRWNVRLKAVPLRTDEYLSDSGTIRVSGSFDRATRYADIPFHFQFSWDRPQINEIVRMAQGRDPGWRGSVDLFGELKGTPADFVAHAEGSVDQFRRYDITRSSSLFLQVSCDQRFISGSANGSLDFVCRMPLSNGVLTAQGSMHDPAHFGPAKIAIVASDVPVNGLVQVLLHAKSTLPNDLSGDGTIDGNWTIEHLPQTGGAWEGRLTAHHASLKSGVLSQPLVLADELNVNFGSISSPRMDCHPLVGDLGNCVDRRSPNRAKAPDAPMVAVIEPTTIDRNSKAQISGEFDNHKYQINLRGEVELARLAEIERLLGGRSLLAGAQGSASVAASYSGAWSFAPAALSGSIHVKSARFAFKGLLQPVYVSGANVNFNGPHFQVQQFAARFLNTDLNLTGNAQGNRDCPHQPLCDLTFSVQANEVSETQLASILQTRNSGLSLPFFRSGVGTRVAWMLQIPAKGTLTIQRLSLRRVQAKNVTARLQTQNGRLAIQHWSGDVFGGKHEGELTLDFSGSRPSISATGTLLHANMEQLATALNDPIGTGVFDCDYRIDMSGNDSKQLANSATGSVTFSWKDGTLRNLHPDDVSAAPLQFALWSGKTIVQDHSIAFSDSKMISLSGIRDVSGSVSFDRDWNLTFARPNGSGFLASGKISHPTITTNLPRIERVESNR